MRIAEQEILIRKHGGIPIPIEPEEEMPTDMREKSIEAARARADRVKKLLSHRVDVLIF